MSTLISFSASVVPQAHTVIAFLAFSVALFTGWASGLWVKLCDNAVAKWPVEWFPSVSATIGDHAPPRAPFQILIALCATPRFLLLLSQWLAHRYPPSSTSSPPRKANSHTSNQVSTTAISDSDIRHRAAARAAELADEILEPIEDIIRTDERVSGGSSADIELSVGIARTFCCGGWVYITSRDHHDLHDLFMILYLILTLPWMLLSTQNAISATVRKRRQVILAGFLAIIPPLIWMYYRHSVLKIPGAYTHYAFFEWSLVFWDVSFDAIAMTELSHLRIAVIDTSVRKQELARNTGPSPGIFLAPRKTVPGKKYDDDEDWTNTIEKGDVPSWRARAAYLSDVYTSVCFWTVYTSLGLQLFYWSVWKLALAGSELALLANLSGYTLSSQKNRGYVSSRIGMLTHRVIMIIGGMGCYFIPSHAARLIGISIGTWTGWLSLYGNWIRLKGSEEMLAEGKVLGVGLVITMLIKYINYSTNPLWATTDAASGGWNITGLLLAGACLYEYAHRPVSLFPAPPASEEKDKPIPPTPSTRIQRFLIPIGLGSLIHMLQTFAMDAGTIIAWTWTGYPIKGPTLHPFAGVVIATAALAILIPVNQHHTWSALGLGGAYALYTYPDWLGFNGGLVVIAYLLSAFPVFIRAASALPPGQTLGGALLVNIILDVASVVTAAYAFVPYGWILRERTDLILVFCMISIAAAGVAASALRMPGKERLQTRSKDRIARTSRWTVYASAVLAVTGLAASYYNMPRDVPKPYYPEHRIFSGGIWTVHFGVDEPGRDSQRRIMELVRDMEVDVLGLLETDLHRFVYGNRDLTRVLAEELGYYVDLGPGPNKHTWGAALLSKFPILNSTHHLLPSPNGELAPAIHATLDIHGEKVNVWVSHNGQEEDALDRELQTTEIARNLRETADAPTIFLGYLVTHPGDQRPWPYQILMEDGLMYDIEIEDRWRWCEYIAFRGLWRIGFARLHESDISDTELQVGKFILPKPGQVVHYETNEELYWHIGENDIPEPWRMPQMFWNEGIRGHHYRVWKGPLYYLPPERSGLQRYGRGWSTALDGA